MKFNISCIIPKSSDAVWGQLSPVFLELTIFTEISCLSRCCGQGGEMTTNSVHGVKSSI